MEKKMGREVVIFVTVRAMVEKTSEKVEIIPHNLKTVFFLYLVTQCSNKNDS
jgi:hypothetical protein